METTKPMHNLRKTAAVNKLAAGFDRAAEKEETIIKIMSDEKNYTREEAEEIFAALSLLEGPADSPVSAPNVNKPPEAVKELEETKTLTPDGSKLHPDEQQPSETNLAWAQRLVREDESKRRQANLTPESDLGRGLLRFYRYKVELETERRRDDKGNMVVLKKGWRRKGELIKVSEIEQRHADIDNEQVENSLQYWFRENQATFVPYKVEENETAVNA